MKTIIFLLLLISLLFPISGKSELIWEKEIQYRGVFQDTYPDSKLYRCGDKFFTFYFGYMQDTEQDSIEKLFRYPGLISFDKNGVVLFQNEEYKFEIENNAKKFHGIDRNSRACICSGDTLKVDIPQAVNISNERAPNIYNFNQVNGNLISIDGVSPLVQWNQLKNAEFTDKELFVLGAWFPLIGLSDLKQNRIDVYDFLGNLNYRLNLKNESFLDLITASSGNFLFSGKNSFITKYSGKKDNTSFIAKFKYDTLEVANVVSGLSFSADLEWLSEFQPEGTIKSIQDFKEMNNGDIISLTSVNVVIKINNKGEVLTNKFLIKSNDDNIVYDLNKIKTLNKSGFTAFFGKVEEYNRRKFVILITDENLNVVEEIKWQYDNFDSNSTAVWNWVEDIIENKDGTLIVLGRNQYFPSQTDKLYIAAIRPKYLTSVKDESINKSGISIYPNVFLFNLWS